LLENEPLSAHTHFGMGGPADLFFTPADSEDLTELVPLLLDADVPILVLGGGTNMLVRDRGFRGLVICLSPGATHIEVAGNQAVAQAGASFQVFSRRCQRSGRTGMEFACGIPGTVGGAIWGNAGAWGGETLDRLVWMSGVNLATGVEVRFLQKEIPFQYRNTDLPAGTLVVEAGFDVEADDPESIQHRMDEMLSQRKASQPLWERNAGCIFKNPKDSSAGLLVDKAGCKGLRSGGVSVSEVHANFMVNLGGGSAEDVLELIGKVRARVRDMSGIDLETEVRILGEHGFEQH
jgi:UDP-N-acetylmuramate dehydrogenase